MARSVWLEAVERLNAALGTYELQIERRLVDVVTARRPDGGGNGNGYAAVEQAYRYSVRLSKNGVVASYEGLDQPEVVVNGLTIRILTNVNVEPVHARERTEGQEAFQAALDTLLLERDVRLGSDTEEED